MEQLIQEINRCTYNEAVASSPAAQNYWHRKAEEAEYLLEMQGGQA